MNGRSKHRGGGGGAINVQTIVPKDAGGAGVAIPAAEDEFDAVLLDLSDGGFRDWLQDS